MSHVSRDPPPRFLLVSHFPLSLSEACSALQCLRVLRWPRHLMPVRPGVWRTTSHPGISQPKPSHLRYCYWGPYPKCISVLYSGFLKNRKLYECIHLFYMYFFVKTFGYCAKKVPVSVDLTIAFPKF